MRFIEICVGAAFIAASSNAIAWEHGQVASAPTPPERQVATRSFPPSGVDATTAQAMSRTGHFTRSTVTSFKIAVANFDTGGVNIGASATITASVEYPQGTCTQLKFSGSSSVTVPNNTYALSDYLTIAIPNNTKFWIRQFYQNANGTISVSNHNDNTNMGDALHTAASGLSDQTLTCDAVTNTASTNIFPPSAIISHTVQPSVCVIGDSIAFGQSDSYSNSSGDLGAIDRSVGPSFGYIDSSIVGDTAHHFSGNPQPAIPSLAAYCSSVISEYGHNDIYVLSSSLATLESDLIKSYGLFSTTNTIFQTTLTPTTTSTDGWITTGNQTTVTGEATRAAFNTALKASNFSPSGGFFDLDSAVGTGTNLSLWQINSPCSSNWTSDGIHPINCSYVQIQTSGVINTSKLH